MSADKRTVSTDALETLGTIIDDSQKRDAIHLAVIPAKAGCDLTPGQSVTFKDGITTSDHRGIAIVDPFLAKPVKEGQMFWMVLRPRLITSLRHVWTHPSLPDEPMGEPTAQPDKAASEAWLRDFCKTADCPDYHELIELMTHGKLSGEYDDATMSIQDYGDGERYLFFSGTDAHGEIPPAFWTHIEIVTGKTFPEKPAHFSCSC